MSPGMPGLCLHCLGWVQISLEEDLECLELFQTEKFSPQEEWKLRDLQADMIIINHCLILWHTHIFTVSVGFQFLAAVGAVTTVVSAALSTSVDTANISCEINHQILIISNLREGENNSSLVFASSSSSSSSLSVATLFNTVSSSTTVSLTASGFWNKVVDEWILIKIVYKRVFTSVLLTSSALV